MPTTLTNGIQLPDKGSVDWYGSMQSNYNLIDTHLGNTDTHVTAEDKANWNSKQGSLSQAQLDAIAQVATNTSDIATLQSGKANASHTHSSSDITDIGDYATKQYVDNSISGLVDNAPAALDTLKELSTALNDDANFASTVTTALAAKADSADLATVATTGSYNDLSNKPTINDSTITIQKNGSLVGTFTVNGSAKTINIPVPTKTSDLTNDSNFVDTSNSAVASGITSAKVTDYDTHIADTDIHVTTADKSKWNNGVSQAYVFRYSSTALVASSTNSNTLLDNTDNLKVGDKVIDSSGVLFSITAIDTVNSTFTVGSALIDLALDANVVHTDEINSSGIGIIEAVKEVGGVDFNTLTTQGLYGTNASGSTNNPVTSPCVVQVIKRLNSVIQIANVSSSAYKSRYIRYCADITAQSPVWLSWIKFATDDDVVHLSGNETVGGIKNFSGDTYIKSLNLTNEVPSQSSTSSSIMPIITTITYSDSSPSVQARLNLRVTADGVKSLYPHENNQYSLGLTSRRWSDFFSYHGNFAGQYQGDEYSGNARTNLTLLANRDTVGQSGCVVDTFRENTAQGTASHIIGFGIKENSVRYEGCRFSWLYDNNNNGYVFALRPTTQGTNRPIKYELGNSSTKWSTFNGINPGALSLPDTSNGVDISSYISYGADRFDSTYTAPADGFITIYGICGGTASGMIITNGKCTQSSYAVRRADLVFYAGVTLPVDAGDVVSIGTNNVTSLINAKFYPCQGNV